jgi:integrase
VVEAVMTVRLTETAINKALRDAATNGQRRDLADAGQEGLRLRVTPAGSASWVLACRDPQGGMRRFPLGAWPALNITEARQKARSTREKVRQGSDPIAEAKKLRAIGRDAKEGIGTLGALLDLYGGPVAKKGEAVESEAPKARTIGPGAALKSWPETRRRVESVFAGLLRRPLATATAGDFQMVADAHPSKASASAAVRYVRPILKWAAQRGYVGRDVALVDPPAAVKRRDRVLSRDELAALLPALSAAEANTYAKALRFMLLTLCRRDEACSATWGDVDLEAGEWRIPETKNGQPHRVPLSRQALELLAGIGAGKPGALIFAARGGEKLANWDRTTKAIMEATRTSGWTRHDLRRTGATMLGEMGVEPHVIEAALNHAAIHSQLASVYNRARYFPAVKDALQLLADRLDGIAAGGAEIRSLSAARAMKAMTMVPA